MRFHSDSALVAVLLTTHLVKREASPLTAREYWKLIATVEDPARLLGLDSKDIARQVEGATDGDRIAVLLDGATVLAFELERLEQSGIQVLTPFDEGYPMRLVDRLAHHAPPVLHVAGPRSLLAEDGVGVVGSRNVGKEARAVAAEVARGAVARGYTVISGLAKGIDEVALSAALEAEGQVIGIPADSLDKLIRDPAVRRSISDERLCVATPYIPSAGFSVGAAMNRNKLIYALSQVTLVVTADAGKGGTWSGATEALDKSIAPVAVWMGPEAGQGNKKLVAHGAVAVDDVEAVFAVSRQSKVESDSSSAEEQLRLQL
ncbi:MAG: DNA-processing protein DprA [Dehalococcoidia bacterium]